MRSTLGSPGAPRPARVPRRRRRAAPLAPILLVAVLASACSYRPAAIDADHAVLAESSHIYAADGTLITTLAAAEHRELIRLADLPDHVADAIVAVEDARFWDHNGLDVRALLRATRANVRQGGVVEGGSTITQQYVKNTMLDPSQTLDRKVREALLAVQLERSSSKERILELYLNTIYFGNGAYGIEAAAREHFGVGAADLSLAQAAVLAGLVRSPSRFDPREDPAGARARRDHVLSRMSTLGFVPDGAARAAMAEPLELAPPADVARYPAGHFVEQVKRYVLDDPRFGATPSERAALLFTGGLRITTTLDPTLQSQAEEAIERVRPPEPGPEAALVSIEPGTGHVRALVGGRDFFGPGARAKVDLAAGGRGRAAGSAFKPLVLAAALEEGIDLETVYPAPSSLELPVTGGVWRVDNYEGGGGGSATLRESTVRSYNTSYARLVLDVGPGDAVDTAEALGVRSPLDAFPSSVLGTNDVRPIDLASSYASLANRGIRTDPTFVTRIERSDGTLVYRHRPRHHTAVPRGVADRVTEVLQEVVTRGTGVAARIGRPAAGKTGTGQHWSDAWFVGYTPELATAVWMGFAEGSVPMVPPATPIRVTGGTWPAQIWQLYMSSALAGVPIRDFERADAGDGRPGRDVPTVRDVVGMPVDPAQAMLGRDGYVVARRSVPSGLYPPGYVVVQSPAAGEPLAGGETVVLEIANGEPPPPTAAPTTTVGPAATSTTVREPVAATVPDLLGLGDRAAARALRAAGLEGRVTTQPEPTASGRTTRHGQVWKQRPAAGSDVERGSVVVLWMNPEPAGG